MNFKEEIKEQAEKGMHGNTKDARKWSGQAVLLVMPGWIMNSLGFFIILIKLFPEKIFRSYGYSTSSVDSMPSSSLERMHFHEPTS